jgi:hypothetical protein
MSITTLWKRIEMSGRTENEQGKCYRNDGTQSKQ